RLLRAQGEGFRLVAKRGRAQASELLADVVREEQRSFLIVSVRTLGSKPGTRHGPFLCQTRIAAKEAGMNESPDRCDDCKINECTQCDHTCVERIKHQRLASFSTRTQTTVPYFNCRCLCARHGPQGLHWEAPLLPGVTENYTPPKV